MGGQLLQLDLNRSPGEKPQPPGTGKDPAEWLYPLFDAYASRARAANRTNPRFSPLQAPVGTLPRSMLLVVPHIDPLVQEQLLFAERVREESAVAVDVLYVEHARAFHGYLNCEYLSLHSGGQSCRREAAADEQQCRRGSWASSCMIRLLMRGLG